MDNTNNNAGETEKLNELVKVHGELITLAIKQCELVDQILFSKRMLNLCKQIGKKIELDKSKSVKDNVWSNATLRLFDSPYSDSHCLTLGGAEIYKADQWKEIHIVDGKVFKVTITMENK